MTRFEKASAGIGEAIRATCPADHLRKVTMTCDGIYLNAKTTEDEKLRRLVNILYDGLHGTWL